MLFHSQKIKQHKSVGVLIVCHFLSSLSWRDKWRVSLFNDFIGRLSLETKPRPKSWPTLSIVWRRLNSIVKHMSGDRYSWPTCITLSPLAWFGRPRRSANEIIEPWLVADFIVCSFLQYQLASRIHNSRMQIAKWYLHNALFFPVSNEGEKI